MYEFRSRRIQRSFAYESRTLSSPHYVEKLLLCLTKELDREHFFVFYLSAKRALVGFETVAVGGMSGVEVHPREVFRGAILAGAFSVIIAHNHPSGNPRPSDDDRRLTRRPFEAGEFLGIPVYGHVIAGEGRTYSFVKVGELS